MPNTFFIFLALQNYFLIFWLKLKFLKLIYQFYVLDMPVVKGEVSEIKEDDAEKLESLVVRGGV